MNISRVSPIIGFIWTILLLFLFLEKKNSFAQATSALFRVLFSPQFHWASLRLFFFFFFFPFCMIFIINSRSDQIQLNTKKKPECVYFKASLAWIFSHIFTLFSCQSFFFALSRNRVFFAQFLLYEWKLWYVYDITSMYARKKKWGMFIDILANIFFLLSLRIYDNIYV